MVNENKKIVVYTDGGARGNPGPAAVGVYFKDLEKKYSQYIGETTNNIAEYQAMIFALKKTKQLFGKKKSFFLKIEVRSDSQLVVAQLNGCYQIKDKSLWPYFIDLWNLKQDFSEVFFIYIPREENKIADRLVNEILDAHLGRRLF